MANVKQIKNDALATIDAAMAIVNNYPDLNEANTELSFDTSTNPFPFLMDLFKTTKGYDAIIKILAKFISFELPVLEAAVKGVLIAKMKEIISCSVNPFFTEEILRNGIVFNIEEVDIADILKYSPYDKVGRYFYFDVITEYKKKDLVMDENGDFVFEKIKGVNTLNPVELYKCDDMDAFIWFIINKANRRYTWKPKKNRKDDEFRPDYPFIEETGSGTEIPEEVRIEVYERPLQELNEALSGGEITQEQYQTRLEELNKKWEKYKKNFYKTKKEDGIITLEYYERSQNLKDAYGDDYKLQTPYNNCLHVFIGDVREKNTEAIINLNLKEKNLREEESKINVFANKITSKNHQIGLLEEEKAILEEKLSSNNIDEKEYKKQYKKINSKIKNLKEEINILVDLRETSYGIKRRFQYEIGDIKQQLKETRDQYFPFLNPNKSRNYYYKKSLIEFNIDYIMSLTLFEEKSLTARLLDALTSVLTIDLNLTYKQQLIKSEVKKMVTMINESDDVVVSDCFFTFSNDDYDAMSREAELKKAGLLTINGDETSAVKIDAQDILSKLNEINKDSSKESIQAVIEGTITSITKQLSNTNYEMEDEVNFGVQMNLIENLLNSLAYVVVCSVLSPKVYLLLLINLRIIGQETNFDLEGFIWKYKTLITDLIRSIRDQILDYLMREILIIVGDLVKEVTLKLSIEQARYYSRLIAKLVKCFKKYGRNLDFNVDDVDYADILQTEEEPKNNEC